MIAVADAVMKLEHGRQGCGAPCDGQSRYFDTVKVASQPIRQPLRVRGVEIDDQADHRAWLVVAPQETDATQLDQAGERLCRPHQKSSIGAFQMNAIVGDQAGQSARPSVRPG